MPRSLPAVGVDGGVQGFQAEECPAGDARLCISVQSTKKRRQAAAAGEGTKVTNIKVGTAVSLEFLWGGFVERVLVPCGSQVVAAA